MISRQRAAVDGRNGAGVDKGTLNQVVDKNEKQHCEREVRKGIGESDTFYESASTQGLSSARYTWRTNRWS